MHTTDQLTLPLWLQQANRSYEDSLRVTVLTPLDKLNQVLHVVQQLVAGGETATCQEFVDGARAFCFCFEVSTPHAHCVLCTEHVAVQWLAALSFCSLHNGLTAR